MALAEFVAAMRTPPALVRSAGLATKLNAEQGRLECNKADAIRHNAQGIRIASRSLTRAGHTVLRAIGQFVLMGGNIQLKYAVISARGRHVLRTFDRGTPRKHDPIDVRNRPKQKRPPGMSEMRCLGAVCSLGTRCRKPEQTTMLDRCHRAGPRAAGTARRQHTARVVAGGQLGTNTMPGASAHCRDLQFRRQSTAAPHPARNRTSSAISDRRYIVELSKAR
jgi:hypothetical protein